MTPDERLQHFDETKHVRYEEWNNYVTHEPEYRCQECLEIGWGDGL